jgi:hypothetical protein
MRGRRESRYRTPREFVGAFLGTNPKRARGNDRHGDADCGSSEIVVRLRLPPRLHERCSTCALLNGLRRAGKCPREPEPAAKDMPRLDVRCVQK